MFLPWIPKFKPFGRQLIIILDGSHDHVLPENLMLVAKFTTSHNVRRRDKKIVRKYRIYTRIYKQLRQNLVQKYTPGTVTTAGLMIWPLESLISRLTRSAVGMKRVESPITWRIIGLASIVAAATAARLRSSSLTSAAGALSGGFIILGGALSTPATELGGPAKAGGGILGGGILGGGIPGGRIKRGGGTPDLTY